MDELCSTLARGSKLVILNAHEGVGAIALQLGQSLRPQQDLWIMAHYPPEFADGDVILKALGASETLCGEVQSALQSLPHSSYDAMLDTVGGRKIYDAGKMILHNNGYFGKLSHHADRPKLTISFVQSPPSETLSRYRQLERNGRSRCVPSSREARSAFSYCVLLIRMAETCH